MPLPSVVVGLLAQDFGVGDVNEACEKAKKIATLIKEILEDAEDGLLEFSEERLVSPDEDELDPSWTPDIDEEEEDEQEDLFTSPGAKKARIDEEDLKKALEYYRSANQGFRSLTSMMKTFRWIKSDVEMRILRRYEQRERDQDDRRKKIALIKSTLLSWVDDKLQNGLPLHDADLQAQSIKINRELFQLPGFKASRTFIRNFKTESRLCSRKITKFVAKKSWASTNKVDAAAKDFVDHVKSLSRKYRIPSSAMFNADQTGLVKELHGARSLAYVGQKDVLRVVNSVSATTHSCMVLPMIAADGSIRQKTLVVLQEPGGRLPQSGMFQADNLVVVAHTSHIMTKALMIEWLKKCVFTNDLPKVSLLVLDSWNPFRDHDEIQRHLPPGKKVYITNIPPGATGKIQPLDVFFFSIFKRFVRRITSHSMIHGVDFKIHQRNNLLKTVSQIMWLFAHRRFRPFVKYAWSAAGYIDRPLPFESRVQYCLDGIAQFKCELAACDCISFIVCPYCEKELCFHHFLVDIHRC